MANTLRSFAIHADDVQRAKRFYEGVFGWRFEAWGPPDFYLIHTAPESERAPLGLLQHRHEPLTGTGLRGFECTIGVDDVAAISRAVESGGGVIVMKEAHIPTVGTLIKFHDTEGNLVVAMKFETGGM